MFLTCTVIIIIIFQFSPDITSSVPHHKHYALEIAENCSPTVDHCRIKSTSVGKSESCTRFSSVSSDIEINYSSDIVGTFMD